MARSAHLRNCTSYDDDNAFTLRYPQCALPVKFAELGRTSYLYKAFGVQNPSHHLISNAEKLVKCFPPSEPASGGCPKGTVSSCLKPGPEGILKILKTSRVLTKFVLPQLLASEQPFRCAPMPHASLKVFEPLFIQT